MVGRNVGMNMKSWKRWKRALTGLLALCCAAAGLAPAALAAPPPDTGNGAAAGENGYVSLHKYVSATDMDDVFRVQLQVKGLLKPKPLLVTFVLDYSSSMREAPASNHVEDRYFRWTGEGLRHALAILADPDQNPAYDHTYINIIPYGRTPGLSLPMSNIELSAASATEVWVDADPNTPLTAALPPVTGWWPA